MANRMKVENAGLKDLTVEEDPSNQLQKEEFIRNKGYPCFMLVILNIKMYFE
jgi:hypothetical protein